MKSQHISVKLMSSLYSLDDTPNNIPAMYFWMYQMMSSLYIDNYTDYCYFSYIWKKYYHICIYCLVIYAKFIFSDIILNTYDYMYLENVNSWYVVIYESTFIDQIILFVIYCIPSQYMSIYAFIWLFIRLQYFSPNVDIKISNKPKAL